MQGFDLKNQFFIQTVEDKEIIVFIAEKESNTGFFSNERIFIIFDKQYIGYINTLTANLPFEAVHQIPEMKKKIGLQFISSIEATKNSNLITIRYLEKTKGEEEFWTINFFNKQLRKLIAKKLLYNIQNKYPVLSEPIPEQYYQNQVIEGENLGVNQNNANNNQANEVIEEDDEMIMFEGDL